MSNTESWVHKSSCAVKRQAVFSQKVELMQSFGELKAHARGVGVSERDVNMALDCAELQQLVQAANRILDTQRQEEEHSEEEEHSMARNLLKDIERCTGGEQAAVAEAAQVNLEETAILRDLQRCSNEFVNSTKRLIVLVGCRNLRKNSGGSCDPFCRITQGVRNCSYTTIVPSCRSPLFNKLLEWPPDGAPLTIEIYDASANDAPIGSFRLAAAAVDAWFPSRWFPLEQVATGEICLRLQLGKPTAPPGDACVDSYGFIVPQQLAGLWRLEQSYIACRQVRNAHFLPLALLLPHFLPLALLLPHLLPLLLISPDDTRLCVCFNDPRVSLACLNMQARACVLWTPYAASLNAGRFPRVDRGKRVVTVSPSLRLTASASFAALPHSLRLTASDSSLSHCLCAALSHCLCLSLYSQPVSQPTSVSTLNLTTCVCYRQRCF